MLSVSFLVSLFAALTFAALGIVSTYPLQSRKNRVQQMCFGMKGLSLVGDSHTSAVIDGLPSLVGVTPGMKITGPGVPIDTTVTIVNDPAHSITISNPTTSTVVGATFVFSAAADGGFNGFPVRLYKSAFTVQVNTVLADLTAIECDYTGYAPIVVDMTAGYVDPINNAIVQSQLMTFAPTGTAVGNQVYGWWIDNGTDVLMGALLASPVTLDSPSKELSLVLQDSFPTAAGMIQVVP